MTTPMTHKPNAREGLEWAVATDLANVLRLEDTPVWSASHPSPTIGSTTTRAYELDAMSTEEFEHYVARRMAALDHDAWARGRARLAAKRGWPKP